jgi:hypothetical protein
MPLLPEFRSRPLCKICQIATHVSPRATSRWVSHLSVTACQSLDTTWHAFSTPMFHVSGSLNDTEGDILERLAQGESPWLSSEKEFRSQKVEPFGGQSSAELPAADALPAPPPSSPSRGTWRDISDVPGHLPRTLRTLRTNEPIAGWQAWSGSDWIFRPVPLPRKRDFWCAHVKHGCCSLPRVRTCRPTWPAGPTR